MPLQLFVIDDNLDRALPYPVAFAPAYRQAGGRQAFWRIIPEKLYVYSTACKHNTYDSSRSRTQHNYIGFYKHLTPPESLIGMAMFSVNCNDIDVAI